ncbi:hypothetical protein PVT67_15455 [Gallaecimonas kandeliae]|uniref:hypothetical protein n=1 Tax=Gallaecimonas kandeliae TaxID=3029055 RepID=UPI00264A1FE5|nr:hypothetical protein [Gallaecimonas kandeliae]WKE65040.1 hypothetical protein PVT67_15455 [Gallaecimonas kandeliae]
MKNKPGDLNNHLFAQLERLSDESLKEDELKTEMARAKALAAVAKQVIDNHRNVIEAEKIRIEYRGHKLPEMLTDGSKD